MTETTIVVFLCAGPAHTTVTRHGTEDSDDTQLCLSNTFQSVQMCLLLGLRTLNMMLEWHGVASTLKLNKCFDGCLTHRLLEVTGRRHDESASLGKLSF